MNLANGLVEELLNRGLLHTELERCLARDLLQARKDQDELLSAMAFIRRSGHAGADIMHQAKIFDWAREIGWKP